jgi:hypothetical protein
MRLECKLRLCLWIVLMASQTMRVYGQARMTQDGPVIRLHNPTIAATLNLSSGEWEILRPEGQLLFSGLPQARKETTAPEPAQAAASETKPKTAVERPPVVLMRPGREGAQKNAPMRRGPKPATEPPRPKPALKASTLTFTFSRCQTGCGPGLRVEAETGPHASLRIAMPDEGSWVFIEPLSSSESTLMLEGMLYPSGDWNRNVLASNSKTNDHGADFCHLAGMESALSSQSAACLHREDTGAVMVLGAWGEGPGWIDIEPKREASQVRFRLHALKTGAPSNERGSNWWFFGAFPSGQAALRIIEPALKTRQDGGGPFLKVLKSMP